MIVNPYRIPSPAALVLGFVHEVALLVAAAGVVLATPVLYRARRRRCRAGVGLRGAPDARGDVH